MNFRWLPIILVAALLVAFRVLGSAFPESPPNFQPLAALFFCGFLVAPGWRGFALPAAVYFLTYPLPALLQGRVDWLTPGVFFIALLSFAAMFAMGKALRPQRVATLLGGTVAAALVFHLITNGAAWIGSPLYPKSLEGLWQSLWTGPVGSPVPSWVFLRNMVCANVVFTLVLCVARLPFAMPAKAATPGLTPAR
jgi:hypothetical protein